MSKVTIYILVLLNLALVVYSANYFLADAGFSWKNWLAQEDVATIPLLIFAVALVSRKMFLVNLTFPFLLVYGPVYFFHNGPVSSAAFAPLQFILMMVDIIYIIVGDFNLKCWKYLFWGLLAGVVLLLIYHRILFEKNINFKMPALRLFGKFTDYLAKFASAHGG